MTSTRIKNKRQYDPPEYDDGALVKWLNKDQERYEKEHKNNEGKSNRSNKASS